MADWDGWEVLLEFHQIGNAVKVTAIDPVSLLEVSIIGDPSVGKELLGRNAVRKLEYVLRKKKEEKPNSR